MANTYTWDFPQIDTALSENNLQNVAKTIHWHCTATSDTDTDNEGIPLCVFAGGTAYAGEANADSFTAFDSLTKDWCKEKVLAYLKKTEAEFQSMLDEQMQNLITPPIVGKTPSSW
tara:strand:- start:139 stop:486 length:348 start_codon:yes stop_codon:yes gene_type:complete